MTKQASLGKLTFDGIKWQVAANMVNRVVSIAAMLVLARFLGPSVFGLYALTMSIVNSFELFKSLGLEAALVRRKEEFELAADTAFVVVPLLGLLLYTGLTASARTIGDIFNDPRLAATIRVLGIAFVFNCFSRVPSAILERSMEFRGLSVAEVVTNLIFPVVAVPLALVGFGIWSLVGAYVLKMGVYMVMVWRYARWKPKLRFSPRLAWEMLSFGKFIFLSSVVFFLRMNLDNLLVGKYLGVAMLGLYALAFNISNFPADYLGMKVFRVVYPAYAKLESDERLVNAFLKSLKYFSMVALPFAAGIIMLGDDFLRIVYGAKWVAAGSALKILAVGGMFNTLPTVIIPVFLTKEKPSYGFYIPLIQVVLYILLLKPASSWMGIEGVAAVVALSSLCAMVLYFQCLRRLMGVTMAKVKASLAPAFVASLAMAALTLALKEAMRPYRPVLGLNFSFALITLCAVSCYTGVLLIFEKTLFADLKGVSV